MGHMESEVLIQKDNHETQTFIQLLEVETHLTSCNTGIWTKINEMKTNCTINRHRNKNELN